MNDTLSSITSSGGVNALTPEAEFARPLTDSDGFSSLNMQERDELDKHFDQKNIGSHLALGDDGRLRIQSHAQTPPVARVIINEFNQRGGLTPESYREFYFGLVQHYCNERQNGTKADVSKLLEASLPYDHIARTMYPELTDEEAQTKLADLNDQILNLGFDMFHPSGKLRDISNMVDNLHPYGTERGKADVVDELIQASGVPMQRARTGFDEIDWTQEGAYIHAALEADGKTLNEPGRLLLDLFTSDWRLQEDFFHDHPEYKKFLKNGEIKESVTFILGDDEYKGGFKSWYLNNDKSPHKRVLGQEISAIKHYNKALIACEIFKMRAEKGEVDAAAEYALVRQLCDETKYSVYREKLKHHGWVQSQAEQELWDECVETSRKLNARADESHTLAKKLKGAANEEQEQIKQQKLTDERAKYVRNHFSRSTKHIVGVKGGSKDTCALIRINDKDFDELCIAHGKDPATASVVAVFTGSSSSTVTLPVKRSAQVHRQHDYEPEFYMNEAAERRAYGNRQKGNSRGKTRNLNIDFHVE